MTDTSTPADDTERASLREALAAVGVDVVDNLDGWQQITETPEQEPADAPAATADLTFVHTRQHGTVLYGTLQGDGSGKILSKHGFSGSEYLEVPVREELGDPFWYMPHTQRRTAKRYYIDLAADELRAAGRTVDIQIDNTTPAEGFWALEARKYQHAAYREERLEQRAGAAHSTATTIRAANDRTYEALNGTPLLVDHYSYTRHKNLLDRLWKREGKAFALLDKAGDLMGRAQAARNFQGRREAHGTTLRRIQKLEKRLRDIEKTMDGSVQWFMVEPLTEGHPSELERETERITGYGCPMTPTGNVGNGCVEVHIGVSEHSQKVLAAEMVETVEEIAYWEDLIASTGRKVWRAEDFAKGDFVQVGSRVLEVVRVGLKSLTVPDRYERGVEIQTMASLATRVRHPRTGTIPYDEVTGKLTAEEARARFPAEFAPRLDGQELPKRPGLKRGKVKITELGGAEREVYRFTIDRQDYIANWPEPHGWFGAPTPVEDPAPIRVFRTFGLSSRPSEPVAEVPVPAGIRWREEVANALRAWVEEFAKGGAADA